MIACRFLPELGGGYSYQRVEWPHIPHKSQTDKRQIAALDFEGIAVQRKRSGLREGLALRINACSSNVQMTPLCKREVALPRFPGSREVRRGGGIDKQAGAYPLEVLPRVQSGRSRVTAAEASHKAIATKRQHSVRGARWNECEVKTGFSGLGSELIVPQMRPKLAGHMGNIG
jgi:hypothetical protein